MPNALEHITKEALSLSRSSRAILADRLLESLTENDQKAVDEAWLREVKRRMKEVNSNKVKLISGEEVAKEVRARFK